MLHSSPSTLLPQHCSGTTLNFNARFNSRPKSFIRSATTRIPGDGSVYTYLSTASAKQRSPGLASTDPYPTHFVVSEDPGSVAAGPAGRIRVTAEVSGDPKMSLVRELAGDIRVDKEEAARR